MSINNKIVYQLFFFVRMCVYFDGGGIWLLRKENVHLINAERLNYCPNAFQLSSRGKSTRMQNLVAECKRKNELYGDFSEAGRPFMAQLSLSNV